MKRKISLVKTYTQWTPCNSVGGGKKEHEDVPVGPNLSKHPFGMEEATFMRAKVLAMLS